MRVDCVSLGGRVRFCLDFFVQISMRSVASAILSLLSGSFFGFGLGSVPDFFCVRTRTG